MEGSLSTNIDHKNYLIQESIAVKDLSQELHVKGCINNLGQIALPSVSNERQNIMVTQLSNELLPPITNFYFTPIELSNMSLVKLKQRHQ